MEEVLHRDLGGVLGGVNNVLADDEVRGFRVYGFGFVVCGVWFRV